LWLWWGTGGEGVGWFIMFTDTLETVKVLMLKLF